MTYEDMQKRIADIFEKCEKVDVYTSPDFQCDQTGGFPTSLCVCFEKGKAWLELKENLVIDRDVDLDYYRQLCADFGIRICCDNQHFNELLQELGGDAYSVAYLPDEDESIQLGGI